MEPNFHNNDYLIVDEISYRLATAREVVVFKYPGDERYFYIKELLDCQEKKLKSKTVKRLF